MEIFFLFLLLLFILVLCPRYIMHHVLLHGFPRDGITVHCDLP